MTRLQQSLAVVFSAVLVAVVVPALAADAQTSADLTKPVTTARIGGSAADREYRTAQQANADRYRDARAACKARPSGERSACVSAARSELKRARLDAQAAHQAALKKAR